MRDPRKIITHFISSGSPKTWVAFVKGDRLRRGYGRTEEEAVSDLINTYLRQECHHAAS